MSTTLSHEGYEIEIGGDGASAERRDAGGAGLHLRIGRRPVDVSRDVEGRFSTSHLPYTVYESVIDLARAVIDHSPDFDTLGPRNRA